MPYYPMEPRRPLLQNLLKCIGNAQLSVDCHRMAMAQASAQRLHNLPMSPCCHCTEVMLIIVQILGAYLGGQPPVTGLGEGCNGRIRALAKQHEKQEQHPQQGQHCNQCCQRPAAGIHQLLIAGAKEPVPIDPLPLLLHFLPLDFLPLHHQNMDALQCQQDTVDRKHSQPHVPQIPYFKGMVREGGGAGQLDTPQHSQQDTEIHSRHAENHHQRRHFLKGHQPQNQISHTGCCKQRQDGGPGPGGYGSMNRFIIQLHPPVSIKTDIRNYNKAQAVQGAQDQCHPLCSSPQLFHPPFRKAEKAPEKIPHCQRNGQKAKYNQNHQSNPICPQNFPATHASSSMVWPWPSGSGLHSSSSPG